MSSTVEPLGLSYSIQSLFKHPMKFDEITAPIHFNYGCKTGASEAGEAARSLSPVTGPHKPTQAPLQRLGKYSASPHCPLLYTRWQGYTSAESTVPEQ